MTSRRGTSRPRIDWLGSLGDSLREPSDLTRTESVALLIMVAVGFVGHLILSAAQGAGVDDVVFQGILTLCFALPVWRSSIFVGAMLLLTAASVALDAEQEAILALALGCVIVVRCCSAVFQVVYFVAFVGSAVGIRLVLPAQEPASGFVAALVVAVGASIIGLVLRALAARDVQSRRRLLVAEQARGEIAMEERRRIADDLHDVVAHDLTVIAMHARLLGYTIDGDERRISEQAIVDSARQALADIRRVVLLVGDTDEGTGRTVYQHGIVAAVADLRDELTAAGYRVTVESTIADEADVDRLVSGTLARVVREAGTNVLKHASGSQTVNIRVSASTTEARVSVWNSLPERPDPIDATRGGYGLVRMGERVLLLGGTFDAAPRDDGWHVEAALPVR
ncbi:sensor histidine kinase [Microbacterium sp. IEGM 1404]|uniref:sensor histidine kinase n=1 Tax=Microbacterium sp. IEGM 1404 TaxID=3047084 RepID=UPI0024B7433C|nr:histidine kinase [Microbacterium sp. IEGM 1404]MDI9892379.1 histidine kinase [Microbacterium sp. IEGM 1404]